MAGLRLRFRSREYDFRPYGSERKDEIDKAWKLLHSFAQKVDMFWFGFGNFLVSPLDLFGLFCL